MECFICKNELWLSTKHISQNTTNFFYYCPKCPSSNSYNGFVDASNSCCVYEILDNNIISRSIRINNFQDKTIYLKFFHEHNLVHIMLISNTKYGFKETRSIYNGIIGNLKLNSQRAVKKTVKQLLIFS